MVCTASIYTFCRNVRYLRKKYHLSRISMSMLLGISMSDLACLETEIPPKQFPIFPLVRLHQVFQISPQLLLCTELEKTENTGE